MRRALILAAAALLLTAVPASAEELPCGTRTWSVAPGKSGAGTTATATDGCHTYTFTTTTGQGAAAGELTFRVSHVLNGWEAGNTLPPMADYCAYQVTHQANMAFVHYFGVPDGTEVRVRYACK